eukprot:224578_1
MADQTQTESKQETTQTSQTESTYNLRPSTLMQKRANGDTTPEEPPKKKQKAITPNGNVNITIPSTNTPITPQIPSGTINDDLATPSMQELQDDVDNYQHKKSKHKHKKKHKNKSKS